jgi:hypothetical protein
LHCSRSLLHCSRSLLHYRSWGEERTLQQLLQALEQQVMYTIEHTFLQHHEEEDACHINTFIYIWTHTHTHTHTQVKDAQKKEQTQVAILARIKKEQVWEHI